MDSKKTPERDALVLVIKTLIAGYSWRVKDLDNSEEVEVLQSKLRLFLRDEFGESV